MNINLPTKLERLATTDKRVTVVHGGRASGKSWGIAILLCLWAGESTQRIVCCRETATAQDRSSKKLIEDTIHRYDLPGFTITEKSITHLNGSEILFLGLKGSSKEDTRVRIKGLEGADKIWIDEAEALSKELLEILDPTIRKDGSRIIVSFNPYDDPDPVREFYPIGSQFVEDIEINYYENPWCPKAIFELAENMKETAYDDWNHIYNGMPISNSEHCIISRIDLRAAVNRKIDTDGGIVVGLDVARFGEDSTIAVKRKGYKMLEIREWKKQDLMTTAQYAYEFAGKDAEIRVDDTGLGCLTNKALLLTLDGWKKPSEIKAGDKIYSKNNNGQIVIEEVLRNSKEDNTDVICINDTYEFSWSHLIPYKSRREYSYNIKDWNYISKRASIFDCDFNYENEKKDITFDAVTTEMPYGGIKTYKEKKIIDSYDFARFLGWFISEGCIENGDERINISQKKKENLKDIRSSMEKVFDAVSYNTNSKFVGSNKSIARWLKQECYIPGEGRGCYRLKIPAFIKNNDKKTMEIFLESFRRGDGYIHKGKNQYITTSETLKDDIIELLCKLNRSCNYHIKEKAGSTSLIQGRILTRKKDVFLISETDTSLCITPKKRENRKDSVYNILISGETHLFITRMESNGKCFWTHNGGVSDRLRQLGCRVIPINFAQAPKDKEKYNSITSEMWFEFRDQLKDVQLVDDMELQQQLSTRKYTYDNKQRRIVESKAEYKKRGFKSPDKADSCILAFYQPNNYSSGRRLRFN